MRPYLISLFVPHYRRTKRKVFGAKRGIHEAKGKGFKLMTSSLLARIKIKEAEKKNCLEKLEQFSVTKPSLFINLQSTLYSKCPS